jgi:hypothetical protein
MLASGQILDVLERLMRSRFGMSLDPKELAELSDRLLEDNLYEIVMQEVEIGNYDQAAKARAFQEAQGDEPAAKALYIKHRIRRLRDLAVAEKASEVTRRDLENEVLRKKKEADMSTFEKAMYLLGKKLSR